MTKRVTEDFIKDAKKTHGEKFDYSEAIYVKAHDKVTVICPKPNHGRWKTTYHSHVIAGHGCQKCGGQKNAPSMDKVIKLFRSVHGLKFDYSESVWDNSIQPGWHSKIKVICREHGKFFITPAMHYYGRQGCRKCGYITLGLKQRKSFEETINEAIKIHGSSYIYLRQFYIPKKNSRGNRVFLEILCKKHPEKSFIQRRSHHLSGSGCIICRESHGERQVSNFLKLRGIKYERQKTFPSLVDKAPLFLDFWLTNLEIIIEYDGEQHHKQIGRGFYKGKLASIQRRDKIKDKWANEMGFSMIRIRWDEDPEQKLKDFFKTFN